MKSSSGEHYLALDHVRAIAAFLVFSWHFSHGHSGWPVPFGYSPSLFLLAPLDEGHTGVALFMALRGYLFAKLLAGRSIVFPAFLWNRFVRLAPLLTFVILLAGLQLVYEKGDLHQYLQDVASGLFKPTLPNGGWSITIEFHFYLLLPFLLCLGSKSVRLLLGVVIAAILARLLIWQLYGEVNWLAYWTIVGRLDQFVLGIVAYESRSLMRNRHVAAALIAIGFCAVYWAFDMRGGARVSPSLHSTSPIWIILPTIEGFCFSSLIAYYDSTFSPANRGLSWFIGRIGAFSYSIYLFHFFLVFKAAELIDAHVVHLSNFYVASVAALFCFLLMLPIGFLSFHLIEQPFLKLRKGYTRVRFPPSDAASTNSEKPGGMPSVESEGAAT